MMSEQDLNECRAIKTRVKREQYIAERDGRRHSPNSKQVIHVTKEEREIQTRDVELTIRLRESTIEKLRDWNDRFLTRTGNERTYDDLVLFLIKSYYQHTNARTAGRV